MILLDTVPYVIKDNTYGECEFMFVMMYMSGEGLNITHYIERMSSFH